jgi:cytoskeletal protein CcmA (bactofilin family)
MLSKGRFTRDNTSTAGRGPAPSFAQSPAILLNSSVNSSDTAVSESHSPGHLAALASATLPSLPAETRTKTTSKSEEASGSRLIVGPDVKLKGAEIQDCDILVVEGRVEATMDSRVIQIASGGAFSGKVGVDLAEIHGTFDGELTARNQLIIHASGRVSGKIRYGKILIEEGGELSGDIASLTSENKISHSSLLSTKARNGTLS